MPGHFDVIVIGVGGMGSAALYHLAARGARTLGLEQFVIPHAQGSSHGLSRIIRLAYWEDPAYVPLVLRARELWRELEAKTGETILVETGSADIGPPDSRLYRGARDAAVSRSLEHEDMSATELMARFPGFRLPPHFRALFQPQGGYLIPERAVVVHAEAAKKLGASILEGERVLEWQVERGTVNVKTQLGSYSSDRLVITAGPWLGGMLRRTIGTPLVPERQVVVWTKPLTEQYRRPLFPVFYLDTGDGRYYGFPEDDIGFKIGKYNHRREVVDPDSVQRTPDADDVAVLTDALARFFPAANGRVVRVETCLFTNTSNEHFVIGPHPDHQETLIAGGCSGHAFKFCSVIGEILASLCLSGQSPFEIGLFDPMRSHS